MIAYPVPQPPWAAASQAEGGRTETLLASLDLILRPIETRFLAAGAALGAAMEDVRGLAQTLSRAKEQAGSEAGHRLLVGSAALAGRVSGMEQGFSGFLAGLGDLRLAVRSIRRDVNELDAVLRTIANVAINARIQGHALYPPRPQVQAFIERLGVMTAEADAVIRQINDATARAQAGLAQVDLGAHDLCDHHLMQMTNTLLRVAAAGRRAEEEYRGLSGESTAIAQRMTEVDGALGRVILSLQVGDSTRQRLQKIRSILADLLDHPPSEPGVEAAVLQLAAALARGAQSDLFQGLGQAQAAMVDVELATSEAMEAARALYFGPQGVGLGHLTGEGQGLLRAMADADAAQAELVLRASDIGVSLSRLVVADGELRRIAHEVRLSGLNAVIVCARLGHEGRALRELAQWLRSLTDESEAILARLRGGLAEAQARADLGASAELMFLRDEVAQVGRGCDGLCHDVAAVQAVLSDTMDSLARAGRSLPAHLDDARKALADYHTTVDALTQVMADLGLRAAVLPQPPWPFAPESQGGVRLAAIRRGYTMGQERAIHDALCAGAGAEPAPTPPDDTGDQEMDDIFF